MYPKLNLEQFIEMYCQTESADPEAVIIALSRQKAMYLLDGWVMAESGGDRVVVPFGKHNTLKSLPAECEQVKTDQEVDTILGWLSATDVPDGL